MEMHNRLVELAKNDFKDLKCFEAKLFNKEDYKDFLYFGVMLLYEAKKLKEELQRSCGGYDPLKPKQFQFSRFMVIKRNIQLGIGTEYLLKAIFLKTGFAINKIKKNEQVQSPYKIEDSVTEVLDPCETVTFWYLKKHIVKIVDCSEFDANIGKINNDLREKDEKEKKKDEEMNVPSPKAYYYKKPNSEGCLNLVHGIRNNYSHSAFIKSEFNGFFDDAFKFLNFLTKKVFGKDIGELYEEFRPEDDKNA